MSVKCVFAIALILIFASAVGAISSVEKASVRSQTGPVHNLNTGLDYATIQQAVDAPETLDGHTIYVDAGSYSENVAVQKSLSFLGADSANTIVWGAPPSTVPTFNVVASNVQITNFTIRGRGILFQGSSNGTVSGNTFYNNIESVTLENTANTSVSGNMFFDSSYAISLSYSSNNTVSRNSIQRNQFNINLAQSSNNTISENNITGRSFDPGIWLQDSSCNNTIEKNNVIDNPVGMWLYISCDDNAVSGNIIAMTRKGAFSADGITVESSHGNIFSENYVENYTNGVRTLDSNSKFYHNKFIDNTQQVTIGSGGNSWDDGYPSGGNYWSDYAGTDGFRGPFQNETGGDGVGDTPYVFDSNNVDRYPWMYPWARLPGDINGDGIVDIYDAILLANAYNSTPGKPNWNPNADINEDGIVDIYDAIILAKHYNQHYP